MWSFSEINYTAACKSIFIGNKNDYNDALAISVAARPPHIKSVAVKAIGQQDDQAQHKQRAGN